MTKSCTHRIATFSSPTGNKNVMTSQNVVVADAYGSLIHNFMGNSRVLIPEFQLQTTNYRMVSRQLDQIYFHPKLCIKFL